MIDHTRLQEALLDYKRDFVSEQWKNEKFKWEAVKHFQDNWDVNATDFPGMLEESLSETYNLLTSRNRFASGMINIFAKAAPEEVRGMFISLFDESHDVVERILEFRDQAAVLRDKYTPDAKQHYQDENAVSTYLWLRYPDKYYIYKYGEVRTVAKELGSDYKFKKGAYADNLRNFYALYDEICAYISTDEELIKLFKSQLTDSCYPDPQYRTLTIDVGFYISRYFSQRLTSDSQDWFPTQEEYSPDISVDQWVELLGDPEVFTTESLEIMKRMKDYGGEATCTQLSIKYGETANFYNIGSSSLAKRVEKATDCPVMNQDNENSKWWPILYVGKHANKKDDGVYIWKLRDELAEALDKVDLSNVELYEASQEDSDHKYWWLNANPKMWSFSDLAIGEIQAYTLYNDNGNKRRIFQNFLDARAGDLVIGYESYPVEQIVAICRVVAEQDGEELKFEKIESLISPIDYATLKACPELQKMEFFANPTGSLFSLTSGEFNFIMDLIRDENPIADNGQKPVYTKEDFLNEVFLTEENYDQLVSLLKNNKNLILQGAPGVGKTFAAKRLAYSMIGEEDDDRIKMIQFHQSYSYEDFIMGYKPSENGFKLKRGIFYQFCKKAENQPDKEFFFIIDEINRGNMSKIFGELLMLIEADYRGKTKVNLAYNDEPFSVPENLYIIGMMNTADRSLAMIDYALRRRFSFFKMEPAFDNKGFTDYQESLNNETFDVLIDKIKDLNDAIKKDPSLGEGFCIGHSYFSNWTECTDEKMKEVVEYDIIPMLEEYWFDDDDSLQEWENTLRGVFQ